jgi:hypothetical protein
MQASEAGVSAPGGGWLASTSNGMKSSKFVWERTPASSGRSMLESGTRM